MNRHAFTIKGNNVSNSPNLVAAVLRLHMCLSWRPHCSRFPNLLYRGFLTRKRFAASKASELATALPIGNRRYSRFGNRYVQRALNRYPIRWGEGGRRPGEGTKCVTSAWTPTENLLAGSARLCFTWRGTTAVKTVKSSKNTGRRPPGHSAPKPKSRRTRTPNSATRPLPDLL